ncbi:TPA: bis(5'-nucleosyl)-tetraphosphatase (symmetrical) YqeK [Streptococcus suis]
MHYQKNYINCDRSSLLEQVQAVIKPKRFQHVLRVEEAALELAKLHGVDLEAVSIGALLHDYCKDMDPDTMLALAQDYWPEPSLKQAGPNVWHGFAAASLAKTKFSLSHPQILQALAAHTIGWYQMPPIVQVVYLADYIEAGRDFPGVAYARQLAQEDLTQASLYKMQSTIAHLAKEGQAIFLPTVDIYNHFVNPK